MENENSNSAITIEDRPPFLLTRYALPRYGASLVLYLQGYVTFFIYTTVFNLNSILTGFSSFLGYLAIAVSQFSMGTISDRTNTRWGRRRPFVLFGTPFLLISFFMLFTPPLFLGGSPKEIYLFLWMLLWNAGFEFFYGFVTTPYQSMLPEITKVNERPRASQLQNIWGMLGTATGLIITFLGITSLVKVIKKTKQLNLPFILIFLICAIVSGLFFAFFLWKMPREKPKYESHESLVANLKECVHNRNFLKITIFQGIASLPPTSSLALGYVQDVLHFGEASYVITALILLFTILAFYVIWRRLIEKKGKKYSLKIILLFGILVLPMTLIGIEQAWNQTLLTSLGMLTVGLLACNIAGWSLFPYILYADVTEDDARRTKNFKAGAYTGFPSIPLNLFQGFSILLTGILVAVLPPLAGTDVTWYYVLWGPFSSGFLIIALIFLIKWVKLDFDWEKDATPLDLSREEK